MTESVAFDHAAGFYDETRGFPPGVAAHVGALFRDAGRLARASHVIEVGIGTGRIALPLSAHVGMVAGVDLARPMLHRLIAKRDGAPVHPVEGDATRLPYPDAAFDAAVDVNVFHLVPGWQDALREVGRVLKPGGVLLHGWTDTPHTDDGKNPNVLLWETWEAVVRPLSRPNVGVPREQHGSFLPDQGWRQIGETHTYTYTRTSTSAEFIDRLERRVWSSMWRLDDDVIERGIAAVRTTMQAQGIDPAQPRETAARFNVAVYAPPAT
jgi:ubiquinone/menaquinone biosynthesis C-methylase UbiE